MIDNKYILHLVLKGKWYDMIKSGEKLEEYREITPYWKKRIIDKYPLYVKFHRGYSNKQTMTFGISNITIGGGRIKWGADPNKAYYVISIGSKILEDE
jgi:hypothetical protein